MPHLVYTAVPAPEHDFPDHPEHAGRVPAILSALAAADLLPHLTELPVTPATPEQVIACHSLQYLAALERILAQAPGYIDHAPTYITKHSLTAAQRAAGGAIAVVDAVLDQPDTVGIALVRPPGHHAVRGAAMGFCLFGNIAIAARHAQARGLERILIYDFDVHHGNGTEDIFKDDPTVFSISSHQRGIYPGTGAEHDTGVGPGAGYTMNIPLPDGAGDAAFTAAFDQLIAPAARRFQPDLILVSAGFDAHFRDPLAGLTLTGPGYHALTTSLHALAHELCAGRLAFVLEGGYDLDALGNSMVNVIHALLARPADAALGAPTRPVPDVAALLARLAARHGL